MTPIWNLHHHTLTPTPTTLSALQDFLSAREGDDLLLHFSFPTTSSTLSIHASRLEHAGGPFSALSQQPFSEHHTRQVALSPEDDLQTFRLLRRYLYLQHVPLPAGNMCALASIICAAHRWQLIPLVAGVAELVRTDQSIHSVEDVIQASRFVRMPGIPTQTLIYFWVQVGRFYRWLRVPNTHVERDEDIDELDQCAWNWPLFKDLWTIAIAQGMEQVVLHCLTVKEAEEDDDEEPEDEDKVESKEIEDLVLGYLEPIIEEDERMMRLLEGMKLDIGRVEAVLQDKSVYRKYSTRAVCLLARLGISGLVPRNEFRWTKEVNLFQLHNVYGFKRCFLFPVSTIRPEFSQKHPFQPLKIICERGVIFHVEIKQNLLGFDVKVLWQCAPDYSDIDYQKYIVELKMISDGCNCMQSRLEDQKYTKTCLVKAEKVMKNLFDSVSSHVSAIVLEGYRQSHEENCRVCLSVVVREKSKPHESDAKVHGMSLEEYLQRGMVIN